MIYYTFLPDKSDFPPDKYNKLQHEKALALLKYAVKKEYEYDTDTMQTLKSEHGKPYFKSHPKLNFNLSHCNGMAVCMISDYVCGVDAEFIRDYKSNTVSRIFSDNEIKLLESSAHKNEVFFRLWTLKECFGKAYGFGLNYKIKETEFILKDNSIITCSNSDCKFNQFLIGNHIISSCIITHSFSNDLYSDKIFEIIL